MLALESDLKHYYTESYVKSQEVQRHFFLKFSAPVSGKKSISASKAGGKKGSECAPAT